MMAANHKSIENICTEGAVSLQNGVTMVKSWPARKKPKHFSEVPEGVAKVYGRSQRLLTIKQDGEVFYESASTSFRRTLELALKSLGRTEKTLFAKIKGMAKDGLIPESMESLATAIRLGGNEPTHDFPLPDDQAKEEALALSEFTELFLMYAFTLPARVAARQARADARKEEAAMHAKAEAGEGE